MKWAYVLGGIAGFIMLFSIMWACVDSAVDRGDQRREDERKYIQHCVDTDGTLVTTGGSRGETFCIYKKDR